MHDCLQADYAISTTHSQGQKSAPLASPSTEDPLWGSRNVTSMAGHFRTTCNLVQAASTARVKRCQSPPDACCFPPPPAAMQTTLSRIKAPFVTFQGTYHRLSLKWKFAVWVFFVGALVGIFGGTLLGVGKMSDNLGQIIVANGRNGTGVRVLNVCLFLFVDRPRSVDLPHRPCVLDRHTISHGSNLMADNWLWRLSTSLYCHLWSSIVRSTRGSS